MLQHYVSSFCSAFYSDRIVGVPEKDIDALLSMLHEALARLQGGMPMFLLRCRIKMFSRLVASVLSNGHDGSRALCVAMNEISYAIKELDVETVCFFSSIYICVFVLCRFILDRCATAKRDTDFKLRHQIKRFSRPVAKHISIGDQESYCSFVCFFCVCDMNYFSYCKALWVQQCLLFNPDLCTRSQCGALVLCGNCFFSEWLRYPCSVFSEDVNRRMPELNC